MLAWAVPSASSRQQGSRTHAGSYITLPYLEMAAESKDIVGQSRPMTNGGAYDN